MKKVLTYGSFDFFHYGHYRLLKRAKDLGDFLIVGLSSDSFNREKNKESIIRFEQRKEVIESFSFVDLVIAEDTWEQKKADILRHNIDILVMGCDWSGQFDELNQYCKVVYLERTPRISTSLIKELL